MSLSLSSISLYEAIIVTCLLNFSAPVKKIADHIVVKSKPFPAILPFFLRPPSSKPKESLS